MEVVGTRKMAFVQPRLKPKSSVYPLALVKDKEELVNKSVDVISRSRCAASISSNSSAIISNRTISSRRYPKVRITRRLAKITPQVPSSRSSQKTINPKIVSVLKSQIKEPELVDVLCNFNLTPQHKKKVDSQVKGF